MSAPILEGQTRALNQQKTASNIVNVVSADQMAGFPDPNVAEAAQRVPGVSLQRDDGEGELMLIRRDLAALNSMTMNGERIPSTESTSRTVELHLHRQRHPADDRGDEKSLRPDQDGDAIGGVVNFVTKQAPEVGKLTGNLEWGYNDLRSTNNPKASVTWGRRFSQKRLGTDLLRQRPGREPRERDDRRRVHRDAATQPRHVPRRVFELPALQRQRRRRLAGLELHLHRAIDVDAPGPGQGAPAPAGREHPDRDHGHRRPHPDRAADGTRRRDVFTNSLGGTVYVQERVGRRLLVHVQQSDRGEPNTALNRYQQSGIRYAPIVDPEGRWAYINPNPQNFDPTRSTWSYNQIEQLFTNDRDIIGGFNLRIPLGSGFMKYTGQGPRQAEDQRPEPLAVIGLRLADARRGRHRTVARQVPGRLRAPGPFLAPETMRGSRAVRPHAHQDVERRQLRLRGGRAGDGDLRHARASAHQQPHGDGQGLVRVLQQQLHRQADPRHDGVARDG